MNSIRSFVAIASFGLLALSACGSTQAGESIATEVAPGEQVRTPEPLVAESQAVAGEVVSDAEARRIDTAMYAEFHGLSIDEADTQIRQREELQTLLDDAESEKGYADSWIDRSDGFRMFIAFSGGVPEDLAARASRYSATLTLVGDAPYSLEQLLAQQGRLHQELLAAGFGDFVTAPRGRAGTILLSVGMLTGDEAAFLPDAALEPNVHLTIQSGPTSEDEGD